MNKDRREFLPRHAAVVMDGNRRWAGMRGLARTAGYKQGLEALRGLVRAARARPLPFLTVYAFSLDNWRRPAGEVDVLMRLTRSYIQGDLADLHGQGIRLRMLGRRDGLESDLLRLIEDAEALTRDNRAMTFCIAFNYGGRDEIARAARRLAEAGREITQDALGESLDAPDVPPPDLILRTGGEKRMSDFLIWQSAYAELVFSDVLWPDFTAAIF